MFDSVCGAGCRAAAAVAAIPVAAELIQKLQGIGWAGV